MSVSIEKSSSEFCWKNLPVRRHNTINENCLFRLILTPDFCRKSLQIQRHNTFAEFFKFQLNHFRSDFRWTKLHVRRHNTTAETYLCFNWKTPAPILLITFASPKTQNTRWNFYMVQLINYNSSFFDKIWKWEGTIRSLRIYLSFDWKIISARIFYEIICKSDGAKQ